MSEKGDREPSPVSKKEVKKYMDKKAINEVRKLFDKNDCRVDRMYGCYVNEQKERIAELKDSFHSLQDEELFKYCEIFKKAVSGRVGRTLFNMEFPLAEEKEGGHQPELYALLKSGLKDPELVDAFFTKVIETYKTSEKYLILLVHGAYDIPGRTSDGLSMADASTDVYEFMEMSICPVKLLRDGLCWDAEEKAFFSRTEDWAVQKPEVGMLYPAFNERNTDIHAALWYAKDDKSRHEELSEALLGFEPPRGQAAEKDLFREVIEVTLGGSCDYDSVVKINDALNQMVAEGKDAGEEVMIDRHDIRRILYDHAEAEEDGEARQRLEEALDRFDENYDQIVGEEEPRMLAENVAEPKKLSIRTDDLKLDVLTEAAELIETRVIDGQEYFLIPVTDNVTVNGIRIRRKEAE